FYIKENAADGASISFDNLITSNEKCSQTSQGSSFIQAINNTSIFGISTASADGKSSYMLSLVGQTNKGTENEKDWALYLKESDVVKSPTVVPSTPDNLWVTYTHKAGPPEFLIDYPHQNSYES